MFLILFTYEVGFHPSPAPHGLISLELVGSDSETNEDGCWLIGRLGLDYMCEAGWIHRFVLRTVRHVAEQWMDNWSKYTIFVAREIYRWLWANMIIVCRWVWTIVACIVYYNFAWEKGKNGRDAFHLRTGGHSWIVMMHQLIIRTISDNNCKTQVGLVLIHWNKILIRAAHKYGRNNHQTICFHPSMQLKTSVSIAETNNRSTLPKNAESIVVRYVLGRRLCCQASEKRIHGPLSDRHKLNPSTKLDAGYPESPRQRYFDVFTLQSMDTFYTRQLLHQGPFTTFTLDTFLDNILWCNLVRMFLHPCWRLCLRVLFNIWRSRTFWPNRCGVWRSWVVRYFGWNCVSVGTMWVSQRKCWNMLQQSSGNICCQCTMIPFVTAQCLDRGVPLYSTCCQKRCDQHKQLIFGQLLTSVISVCFTKYSHVLSWRGLSINSMTT